MPASSIYRSHFAGLWYPSDPGELASLLETSFFRSADRTSRYLRPGAAGFVVPHAGPQYSGAVAASVYRNIQQSKPRRIFLLGFSHSHPLRGIGIPNLDAYAVPNGEVPVDRAAVQALLDVPPFHAIEGPAGIDHSVEIQLPFLAYACPGTPIVPLYVGRLSDDERKQAAVILRSQIDADTILIASSDLTHYGREFGYSPFALDHFTPERLRDLDEGIIASASSLEPAIFYEELQRTRSNACGRDPIALLLETIGALTPEIFQETLDYQTSGEIVSDFRHSVSYGALGYFPFTSYELSPTDQQSLLQAAQLTLRNLGPNTERNPVRASGVSVALEQRAAVFVSIYSREELRGCIGRVDDPIAIAASVPELALSAALDDPRFNHVHAGEPLDIEVHILTTMKLVSSPDRFIVNEHGGLLERGLRRGLLLPVVAKERHWNRDRFLAALADKAGLPRNAYNSPDTRLSVFRAQTFTT